VIVELPVLVAVPEFNGRVSPTFDFCHRVTLWKVDVRGSRRVGVRTCRQASMGERATQLRALGVTVLLCGAIGNAAARTLEAAGLQVLMGIAGPVPEVVAAFVCGGLDDPRFWLPGFERHQGAATANEEG
jgi:predicted Fe-Mo cluster-binding NifX family protein